MKSQGEHGFSRWSKFSTRAKKVWGAIRGMVQKWPFSGNTRTINEIVSHDENQ